MLALVLSLAVTLGIPGFVQERAAGSSRIVAIGDVHGDFDAFVAILHQAGLLGANNEWTGASATLIQTGDFTDRGPQVRKVMDLLIGLQKDASRKGGRVIVLLGNHEVMNIMGDLRYVTAADYAAFADVNSEKRRQQAYQAHLRLRKQQATKLNQPLPNPSTEEESQWMRDHPPGFLERNLAFGPRGTYGRWLRQHDFVTQIGGSIFLHGGISPKAAGRQIKDINQRIRGEISFFDQFCRYMEDHGVTPSFYNLDELTAAAQNELALRKQDPETTHSIATIEEFLKYPQWLCTNPDGPLWFRGYALWSDGDGARTIDDLLTKYGAQRFVVGHTVQADGRIRSRFGGKVLLIDTGMLSSLYVGGRASALEILGDQITALYADQRTVLSGPQ